MIVEGQSKNLILRILFVFTMTTISQTQIFEYVILVSDFKKKKLYSLSVHTYSLSLSLL